MVVHLLEAGGTGAGVRLVAGETQVAAASVVGATAVSASYRTDGDTQLSVQTFTSERRFLTRRPPPFLFMFPVCIFLQSLFFFTKSV